MLGVAYEAPSLATGYGSYIAQVSCVGRQRRGWSRYCRDPACDFWLQSACANVTELFPSLLFQPLMRNVLEKKATLSKQEARALIERCMKILYYRDARSFNRVSCPASCQQEGRTPKSIKDHACCLTLSWSSPGLSTLDWQCQSLGLST